MQMLQAKRRYMRFVSHEVRSPLNAVCMGVTLLKEEIEQGIATSKRQSNQAAAKSFKEWLTLLEDVSTSAQSSVHVLDELLHYDKIQSGTLDLDLSVLSVWDMIVNAASAFELVAKMKNVSFNLDKTAFVLALSSCGDVSQHCVVGDEAQLSQILQSLVANAIKFTPEGGKQHHQRTAQEISKYFISNPTHQFSNSFFSRQRYYKDRLDSGETDR